MDVRSPRIVMENGCVGPAAVVTGETSLCSTEVYAGAIKTTNEMTNPAMLSVCYATAASLGW